MRTRFAPSPTGSLHIGGLRTALFAWLVAKQTGGEFLLRVEDTDQAREVPGSTEDFVRILTWAGLAPDEGVMLDAQGMLTEAGPYGPYHQSKRLTLYRTHVDQLLKDGHAYHCFCTAERLDLMRTQQQERRMAPMYDRTCLHLSASAVQERLARGETSVIRLKVPHTETITFQDDIYGTLTFKGHTIDDQVLLKSDGFPTYHLAHVVDDHHMKIDCVIRGEEWLSSLPKHLLLWRAFGWKAPRYAHMPLILNKDRTKLSKRQGDTAAGAYVTKGYLPEALLNFLVLLGWNPGTEQEIFTLEELKNLFSLDRVHKSGAVFDLEKLAWLQGQWMRRIPLDDFVSRIHAAVAAHYPAAQNDPGFREKAALIQERITFFTEAPEMLGYFYEVPQSPRDVVLNPKQKVTPDNLPTIVQTLEAALAGIDAASWHHENLVAALDAALLSSGMKRGQILWVLRAILTGRAFSPGAYEVALLLGKDETLRRIRAWSIAA